MRALCTSGLFVCVYRTALLTIASCEANRCSRQLFIKVSTPAAVTASLDHMSQREPHQSKGEGKIRVD